MINFLSVINELNPGQIRIWDGVFLPPQHFLLIGQDSYHDKSSSWKILSQDGVDFWPEAWIEAFSRVIYETR
jgi:hypothetical protein